MSDLTKNDVKKVAKLARIEVSDADLEKFTPELKHIINFVEQLSEVDTENTEAMTGVGSSELRARASDEITDGNIRDKVLANAPKTDFGCFVVPKVVG